MNKIINTYPPNIEEIRKNFTLKRGIIFTYGDKLYVPDGGEIDDALMKHEETHTIQQGDNPDRWWKLYFLDKKFRLNQELEAYRNQYKFAVENYNRPACRRLLAQISKDLSGEMYGNIITKDKAKEEIINT